MEQRQIEYSQFRSGLTFATGRTGRLFIAYLRTLRERAQQIRILFASVPIEPLSIVVDEMWPKGANPSRFVGCPSRLRIPTVTWINDPRRRYCRTFDRNLSQTP